MRVSSGSAHPLDSIKSGLIAEAALLGGSAAVVMACVLPLGGDVSLWSARNVLMESRTRGKGMLDLLPLHISFSLVLPLVVLQEGGVAPPCGHPRVRSASAHVRGDAGREECGNMPSGNRFNHSVGKRV